MAEEADTKDDETEAVRIEGLARALARAISTAPSGQRERLREMAVHVLRDEVEISRGAEPLAAPSDHFNPFGIGIPLCLAGGVMMIMFPPVGLLLFGAAALMMAWGIAAVLFVRR